MLQFPLLKNGDNKCQFLLVLCEFYIIIHLKYFPSRQGIQLVLIKLKFLMLILSSRAEMLRSTWGLNTLGLKQSPGPEGRVNPAIHCLPALNALDSFPENDSS